MLLGIIGLFAVGLALLAIAALRFLNQSGVRRDSRGPPSTVAQRHLQKRLADAKRRTSAGVSAGSPEAQVFAIREQAKDRWVVEELGKVPIATLKLRGMRGATMRELQNQGIRTLADIPRLSSIPEIRGVGETIRDRLDEALNQAELRLEGNFDRYSNEEVDQLADGAISAVHARRGESEKQRQIEAEEAGLEVREIEARIASFAPSADYDITDVGNRMAPRRSMAPLILLMIGSVLSVGAGATLLGEYVEEEKLAPVVQPPTPAPPAPSPPRVDPAEAAEGERLRSYEQRWREKGEMKLARCSDCIKSCNRYASDPPCLQGMYYCSYRFKTKEAHEFGKVFCRTLSEATAQLERIHRAGWAAASSLPPGCILAPHAEVESGPCQPSALSACRSGAKSKACRTALRTCQKDAEDRAHHEDAIVSVDGCALRLGILRDGKAMEFSADRPARPSPGEGAKPENEAAENGQ